MNPTVTVVLGFAVGKTRYNVGEQIDAKESAKWPAGSFARRLANNYIKPNEQQPTALLESTEERLLAADQRAEEIIAEARTTADEIIATARAKAEEIVASAVRGTQLELVSTDAQGSVGEVENVEGPTFSAEGLEELTKAELHALAEARFQTDLPDHLNKASLIERVLALQAGK